MKAAGKRDSLAVCLLAAVASLAAFLYYYRLDAILLYGDAVAHINIARRVFDSQAPGPMQFGTVWLPLPHLLILPFTVSDWMWRTGVGGAIPSMLAYLFGAAGVFRLVALLLADADPATARLAAWLGALIYAANPNLLYLQATAMTEPLYLALFIWAVVFFLEYVRESAPGDEDARRRAIWALRKCGLCVAAAMLSRYDGWFAGLLLVAAAVVVWTQRRATRALPHDAAPLWRGVRDFVLLAAAVPLFWFAYNYYRSGDAMDFATGPYSARAIAERTTKAGDAPHPGHHDLPVAATFFRKAAELNLGEGRWQHVWFWSALLGTLVCFLWRRAWPALLLWAPLPFYALSIAYGSVPIFLPVWWPYSYYNVRYGLQLLPAIAVLSALAFGFIIQMIPARAKAISLLACAVLVAATYSSTARSPISLREAQANSRTRIPYERRIAEVLRGLPGDSIIAMYLGDHGGALQRAGIPLRRTVNESTHRHGEGENGLWERTLKNPQQHVDYLVAIDGNPLGDAAARHQAVLAAIATIDVPGQPRAVIYKVRRTGR